MRRALSGSHRSRKPALEVRDEIVGLLEELNRTDQTTIVMVTHDPRMAERSSRIVRLFDGRLVN